MGIGVIGIVEHPVQGVSVFPSEGDEGSRVSLPQGVVDLVKVSCCLE